MDPPDDAEVGATQQGSPKCSDSEKSDRVDAPGAVDAYGDKGITRAGRAGRIARPRPRSSAANADYSCPRAAVVSSRRTVAGETTAITRDRSSKLALGPAPGLDDTSWLL